ncbi:MAG: hypothetical protein KF841_07780 [Phycisphaerae bacterium]|nr:hypothetical protein [Phycisphaerae bacterium]
MRARFKDWIPATAAVCTLIVAVAFAINRTFEVSDEIRNMTELSDVLAAKAGDVQRETRTPEELEQIARDRSDFESRIEDSNKPSVVVSQLSEAARHARLQVLEIQPLTAQKSGVGNVGGVQRPSYRVLVRGGYQDISTYLQSCRTQRVPVRVIGFEISRFSDDRSDGSGDDLRADVVVEPYVQIANSNDRGPGAS